MEYHNSQQVTKTLGTYAESIRPGDEDFVKNLTEILGVDSGYRLYSLDAEKLQEALQVLLPDITSEELANIVDPFSAQIISREYWADDKLVQRDKMIDAANDPSTPTLSDSFWDLFKVKN